MKGPISSDVKVLKAFTVAPCTPELRLIASATVLAVFVSVAVKSAVKFAAKALKPLILMSDLSMVVVAVVCNNLHVDRRYSTSSSYFDVVLCTVPAASIYYQVLSRELRCTII